MPHQIAELLGVLAVVVGCGTIVAAASMVSVALAVLAAGIFLVTGGIVAVYVAAVLDSASRRKPGDRP